MNNHIIQVRSALKEKLSNNEYKDGNFSDIVVYPKYYLKDDDVQLGVEATYHGTKMEWYRKTLNDFTPFSLVELEDITGHFIKTAVSIIAEKCNEQIAENYLHFHYSPINLGYRSTLSGENTIGSTSPKDEFTAEKARQLTESNIKINDIINEILEEVKEACSRGDFYIRYNQYGYDNLYDECVDYETHIKDINYLLMHKYHFKLNMITYDDKYTALEISW